MGSARSLMLMAVLALAAIAAVPAAGAQEASPVACSPLSPEAIRAQVQRFVDATNVEDVDLLGETLHETYVHNWGAGPDVLDREGYLATMERLFDAFDDFAFTADEVIVADDTAVVRVTASGTQVRAFGGFPPSGHPATWTGIYIFRLNACGQIVEAWAEFDHLGRLLQQGSIVAPEATPAA